MCQQKLIISTVSAIVQSINSDKPGEPSWRCRYFPASTPINIIIVPEQWTSPSSYCTLRALNDATGRSTPSSITNEANSFRLTPRSNSATRGDLPDDAAAAVRCGDTQLPPLSLKSPTVNQLICRRRLPSSLIRWPPRRSANHLLLSDTYPTTSNDRTLVRDLLSSSGVCNLLLTLILAPNHQ